MRPYLFAQAFLMVMRSRSNNAMLGAISPKTRRRTLSALADFFSPATNRPSTMDSIVKLLALPTMISSLLVVLYLKRLDKTPSLVDQSQSQEPQARLIYLEKGRLHSSSSIYKERSMRWPGLRRKSLIRQRRLNKNSSSPLVEEIIISFQALAP